MEAVNAWIECLLATIILIGVVETIVPEGETKKFVFLITGVIVSIVIATPVIKLFSSDFSLSDVTSMCNIENDFYYIDTLRNTVDKQSLLLEEVFANNVVDRFNNLYEDMEISECKISFLHDETGKIVEVNEVCVTSKWGEDDVTLLKQRIAEICEVSVKKVRVN